MILSEVRPDAGAVSIEYVLVVLVGVALAGMLFAAATGVSVEDLLASLIESALEEAPR